MKKFITLTLLILLKTSFGHGQAIVSGISTNEINIDTNFHGTKILLFGARGDAGNIIITVRGPKKNYIVSKKQKLLGIWYNGQRVKFNNAFSYYSIFSTLKNHKNANELLEKLELGTHNIKFNAKSTEKVNKSDFTLHLIKDLEQKQLYSLGSKNIEFLDETLFKIILDFPKNISRGVYSVEIYLINESKLVSFQSIPIYVNQTGFSAQISDYAHQQPLLYGLLAILIALVIGWLANHLFTRYFK